MVLLAGCDAVYLLYPLYTDADLVYEQPLEGHWRDQLNDRTLVFESRDAKSYWVTMHDAEFEARMVGRLTRIGEALFLDLALPDDVALSNEFHNAHLFRAHSFARLRLEGDRLEAAIMDVDWLREKLKKGELIADCLDDGRRVLLTGATSKLRELIAAHADNDEVFPAPFVFERAPAPAAPEQDDAEGAR